jgi:DNA-binding winged helix-turn-helix (wHTH) protein/cytochrome c-type biogenesis protein CcmH/NrfG
VSSRIVYVFGPFELDPQARRLLRDGQTVSLAERHFDVLHHLVAHAGSVVAKDTLVEAAWQDVAVTDNSLEQAVSGIRRALGGAASGGAYIETVPRRGYRFTATVARSVARATDASLDALLAPHRAWLEGRAALETLERAQIVRARELFEQLLPASPDERVMHIGLANAYAMQFETTRVDEAPDIVALNKAADHAREACRLDADSGEAWATLGFVLDRTGNNRDALAALRRAVTLEPDNWRHHFRLSFVGWGEERLRAARRTLALLPGFPLAHWMIATVHVARNVLDDAERELAAGIASQDRQGEHSRFSPIALHWLRGLIHLSRDEHDRALAEFERELSFEASGHLYARECCANTWYAIGALRLRQTRLADARLAFQQALERVRGHALSRIALAASVESGGRVSPQMVESATTDGVGAPDTVDAALGQATAAVLRGDVAKAARSMDQMLSRAKDGSAGWLLPVEPLLHVAAHPDIWAPALARLRTRAV